MIKQLRLQNFKCFGDLSLELRGVNVLMGINGMGKSTVIQSLLLLRQSFRKNGLENLKLNGEYVQLGNGQDVLKEDAQTEEIGISIKEDDWSSFTFSYLPMSDSLPEMSGNKENKATSVLFGEHFVYLSAYRIEPRELYGIGNENEVKKREFMNSGEYALHYLKMFGPEKVKNSYALFEGGDENDSLQNQTRLWMSVIAPGVLPRVSVNKELRTAELRYEFVEGNNKTNPYKSVNVGFGITYVLPIIVAILSAEAGDLILLENPEAHIHPAGQRMLGELIAVAGAGGVQIIVETHSDHVINGIRLAVKNGKVKKEHTQIFFFYKDVQDGYEHKVVCPQIEEDGRIDFWPEGFLDEWDHALMELL